MYYNVKVHPLGGTPCTNSVNGLSAQTFCSCTKDSYFIVPHENLRILYLKFTLKLKTYRGCKMGPCTYSQSLIGDPGWTSSTGGVTHGWCLRLPLPLARSHSPNKLCKPVVLGVGPPGSLAYPSQCQSPPLKWSRIPISTASSLCRKGWWMPLACSGQCQSPPLYDP